MAEKIKPKKRKRWLWVMGGIFLLIIIIAIASGGEKKEIIPKQQLPQEQTQTQGTSQSSQGEQKEATWHNTISFSEISNSSDKKTQPILIKGKRWRIKWVFQDSG